MSSNPTSPLRALLNILNSRVEELESAYAKSNQEYPSLDEPFRPGPLDFDPSLAQTRHLIVAAAAQLIATVRSPIETLQDGAPALFLTATLGFVVDTHVADVLKEAGPQGLHVKDISAVTGVDHSYLARVLRFLATRHIFKEVSPNVFTNNCISSLLMKTKSVKELQADPVGIFDDAPLASFISVFSDDALKSAAHFSSYLQKPDVADACFNIAFNTPVKLWDWIQEPGNELRSRRFTAAMKGGADRFPPAMFAEGINGSSLKPDDVVVDVGGSIGTCTLLLLKSLPHLRYVVQDLEKQIIAAKPFWEENAPDALKSGRVQLQVHDFFTPQPVKNAAVYFLRVVVHDWPDKDAKRILSNIRSAAGSNSKLVLFDTLARYTCDDPSAIDNHAPSPLLSNLGIGGAGFDTALDMQMLTVMEGKERTADEFRELGQETGWKLESLKPGLLAVAVYTPA